MDVLYPYKRSPDDYELRYSLRSLVNVPHDRVIIAGDVPLSVSDRVDTVRNPRVGSDRYMSSTSNFIAALARTDVSDDFIAMNDDIFVLKPWTFRHEHRDVVDEAKGDYLSRINSTNSLLRSIGISQPLFFGLHTPTVYNKQKLLDLLREFPMPKHKYLLRTMYHNVYSQPSVGRADVKVKDWTSDRADDILSISDNVASDPAFKTWINERFPNPSVYEVTARG